MAGFRVTLDFSDFFVDEKRKSYFYVENELSKTISQVLCRIKKLFHINNEISLLANGCFLHPDETVLVLYEGDIVKVVHAPSTSKNIARNGEEVIFDVMLKRKHELEKEQQILESTSKSREEKASYLNSKDNNEDVIDHISSVLDVSAPKKASPRKKRKVMPGAELPVDGEMLDNARNEVDSEDSGVLKKKKRKAKKWKDQVDGEDYISTSVERSSGEASSLLVSKIQNINPDSVQEMDSGLEVSEQFHEKETGKIEESGSSFMDISCASTMRNREDASEGYKKKRRRRRKPRKGSSEAVNDPPAETDVPRQDYVSNEVLSIRKHIKFPDGSDEDKASRKSNGNNVLEKDLESKLSTEKQPINDASLSNTNENQISHSLNTDDTNTIGMNASQNKVSDAHNGILKSDELTQKQPQVALKLKQKQTHPHSKWDTNSENSNIPKYVCGPPVSQGNFIPRKNSTPLIFECKRPALEKTKNSSANSKTVQDFSKYPMLSGQPKENDILAFKVWKLAEDYTPGISEFIVGKVLLFSEAENQIKLKILQGNAELRTPMGKFSLDQPQEDEETIELEEIEELEKDFKDLIDVHIVFP